MYFLFVYISSIVFPPTNTSFPGAFAVFRKDVGCDFESPVKQGLANDRADGAVVKRRVGFQNLVAELGAEPPLGTRALAPSRNLPGIVGTTAALIEPAVPLKPPVGVAIDDPSAALPHPEGTTTFHPVLVHGVLVIHGCQAAQRNAIYPFFGNRIFQYILSVIANIRHSTHDRPEIGASEGSCSQNVFGCAIRMEVFQQGLDCSILSANKREFTGCFVALRERTLLRFHDDGRRREDGRVFIHFFFVRHEPNPVFRGILGQTG
mmetsp:Transcript_9586/g.22615  ORF Transcript_9586/g.22615 Transcript_9586/m.22615 type:complete len:263 (+) Transcript_9586:196-984(+)